LTLMEVAWPTATFLLTMNLLDAKTRKQHILVGTNRFWM
jgi:hypothetical protein